MHPQASGREAADASAEAAAAALATGSAELLGQVLGQLPVGVGLLDPDLRWQYVNPAFVLATGLSQAELVGRPLAGTPQAAAAHTLRLVLADGRPREAAAGGPRARYQRLELAGRPAGLIAVLLEDARPEDRSRHDLEQARARLAMLHAAAGRIGTTLDIDTTCTELAEFTVPGLADLTTVDVLPPGSAERDGGTAPGLARLRRTAVACAPELRPHLDALTRPGGTVRHREGSAAARSLAAGRPVAANLLTDAGLAAPAADAGDLAAYRAAGIDSLLVVPLTARGRLNGVLSLARRRGSSLGFTEDDITLVEDLAGRAAVSIDNARRYAHSQDIALELQRALLAEPGNPHPNLELASRYLASGTTSVVGGDWYETVRLPFGRTLLVIGDVMGHGVEAAVDMSNYRSMLRYVAAMDLPPHRILRQLDTLISEDEAARPATCLLALADPGRGRWTFSSAGHLPPALIVAGEPTELVTVPTGPPLGTGFGGYEQATRDLLPEQVLLLYTDGLVERRGEDIDASLARLAGLRLPATGALPGLLDALLGELAPRAAEDDIALLAARVRRR
ncbi:SpoIIE family protein phosphatase [Kitasatospora indigofera]|uniref:SpoIIE family protein phosphatase n=1 Tax=Kitasatospora indigofera TaxID=67307 RepID=UPI0036592BFF